MPRVAYRKVYKPRQQWFDYRAFRREVEQTIDKKTKPDLIQAHKRVVSNWTGKPEFKARKFVNKDGIKINVFPAGEYKMRWIWVSRGTKGGYKIPKTPKPKGDPLRFKTGYKPRTVPVGKFGGPGVYTGPWASALQVTHPGIKAREFEKTIAADYKKTFARDMNNAMKRGIRRARRS